MNSNLLAKKCNKHKVDKKKSKKKEKLKYKGAPIFLKSAFNKSWLLESSDKYSNRILTTLSPYKLSFQERYTRILYFNKLNEYEKIFWEKQKANAPETKYMSTQTDCFKAYNQNQKLRWAFKKLFLAWKLRKMTLVNETDLITLEIPKNPIYILDFKTNKKYIFEAKSVLIDSVNRFLLHYDFFPESKKPRNLLTNEELTWSQLWCVSNQMKKMGISHWTWEGFCSHHFSLAEFVCHFDVPLRIEMVNRCFKDPLSDSNWHLSEFINSNTIGMKRKWLKWAVYNFSDHPYMKQWKQICFKYWKLAVRIGESEAADDPFITEEIDRLLENDEMINLIKNTYITKYSNPIS